MFHVTMELDSRSQHPNDHSEVFWRPEADIFVTTGCIILVVTKMIT